MKLIYIAGPFRGKTQWEIHNNTHIAETAAYDIWHCKGYVPITPHLLGRNFYGSHDEDIVMEGLLELLSRCDGVYLLPGWQKSEGTLAEKALAEKLGIPVSDNWCRLSILIDERLNKDSNNRGYQCPHHQH